MVVEVVVEIVEKEERRKQVPSPGEGSQRRMAEERSRMKAIPRNERLEGSSSFIIVREVDGGTGVVFILIQKVEKELPSISFSSVVGSPVNVLPIEAKNPLDFLLALFLFLSSTENKRPEFASIYRRRRSARSSFLSFSTP